VRKIKTIILSEEHKKARLDLANVMLRISITKGLGGPMNAK
jgi:hypothetical protein